MIKFKINNEINSSIIEIRFYDIMSNSIADAEMVTHYIVKILEYAYKDSELIMITHDPQSYSLCNTLYIDNSESIVVNKRKNIINYFYKLNTNILSEIANDEDFNRNLLWLTFKSKNIKFWDRYQKKPEMFGIINIDPHLYSEVGDVKIILPLNLAWITTDTSYHNFGLDKGGRADCLCGLCILKSIKQYTEHTEAIFSPLVIGIYDLSELMYGDQRTRRTKQIRLSW